MILGIKIDVKIADIVSSLKDQESYFCQNQFPSPQATCCKRLSPSRDCIWSSGMGRSGPPCCGCHTSRQTSHTPCQGGSRTPWCSPAGECPSPRTLLTPQISPQFRGQARKALKSRDAWNDDHLSLCPVEVCPVLLLEVCHEAALLLVVLYLGRVAHPDVVTLEELGSAALAAAGPGAVGQAVVDLLKRHLRQHYTHCL